MTTIRIQGGMFDRGRPGYIPDPAHATRGTYETEPLWTTTDPDGEMILAVCQYSKKLFKVVHVPTGLAVPAAVFGESAFTGVERGTTQWFHTKTAARKFMLAVQELNVLPAGREPSTDELWALRNWLSANYPVNGPRA